MPKRTSIKQIRKRKDINLLAKTITKEATKETIKKNPAAVALGKLGGLKGGKARALALSSEERSEIARMAALARWKKEKG